MLFNQFCFSKTAVAFFILCIITKGALAQAPTPALAALHRDPSQVKKEFPYNIRLIDSTDKAFNSAQVFKKSAKPLVVLHWLTTCAPCKAELETFKKNFEAWQTETPFTLVAVSEDFEQRHADYIKRTETAKYPFKTFHDFDREFPLVLPGELNGMPQLFIYNAKGDIVFHKKGFIYGEENELLAAIKSVGK